MQPFVANLTAALLFIHTVLGCCWHHAHACEQQMVTVDHSAKCCHHHQHRSDGKQHEKPGKCKVECEGTCIYVVPQKVKVEAPDWITMGLLAVLPSLADQQCESAPAWRADWFPPDLVPPLRTHLLHQVFLN